MFRRLESSIEATCRAHAEARGYLLVKITAIVGFPDRLLVMPEGVVAWVEFKRPFGRLSAIQRHRAQGLLELGHRVFVLDTVGAFDNLMDDLEHTYNSRSAIPLNRTRSRDGC